MTTNVSERDVGRAVRWLSRNRWPLPFPREAGDLLATRLAVRNRIKNGALAVLGAIVLLTFIWDITSTAPATEQEAAASLREGRLVRFAFFCLPSLLFLAGLRAAVVVDRRIAQGLPQRMSRTATPPALVVLGRVRAVVLAAVVVLGGASCTAVWMTQPMAFAVTVTVLVFVAVGFSLLGVRTALRRPTVAFDVLTLALDERLRSEEASLAGLMPVYPVVMLMTVSPPSPGQTTGWYLVSMVCSLTVLGLLIPATWRQGRGRQQEAWAASVQVDPGVSGEGGASSATAL